MISNPLGSAIPPGLQASRPAGVPELPAASPDRFESAPASGVLGKLGLTSMACLAAGTAVSAPAAAAEEHALVVFDDYSQPDDPAVNTHGQLTQMILEGRLYNHPASGHPVQRLSVPAGFGNFDAIDRNEDGSFDRYVEQRFLVPAQGTAAALLQAAHLGERAVVSQSQGASDSRVVESLWGQAQWDQPFVASVARQLQVEHPEDPKALLSAMAARVHQIHTGDPAIREAHQQVLQAAQEADRAGVIRVVSAGNQGELEKTLQQLNVKVDADFYRSDLIDPRAIIVGAADDHHHPMDVTGYTVAALASPDADAMVAANGVNVQLWAKGKHEEPSGSSWAAPQVARYVDHYLDAHPQAGRDEVLHYLQGIAHPLPGTEKYLGAGVLPPDFQVL